MSNAEFKRNFAKVLKRAGGKAEAVTRAAMLEILRRVIEKSPVGDPSMWQNPDMAPEGYVGGRFKANWQAQVGSINYDTSADPDGGGSAAMARARGIIAAMKMGGTMYLTNSLPYAKKLEFEGYSRQAPAGMVRVTVVEFRNIIKKVAAKIP